MWMKQYCWGKMRQNTTNSSKKQTMLNKMNKVGEHEKNNKCEAKQTINGV
jgi:hypothetical protein